MIIWLNGTHGVGKTTTSALVQQLIPDSRVFDAEKVGEMLMDITPALPETDNFQHWPPWRPLVVESARHLLEYTGGTLVMPMTVLIQQYWREISAGLAEHDITVRHFVLHADQETLRERIACDHVLGPNTPFFRLQYLESYAEAAEAWLHQEAEVVETTPRGSRPARLPNKSWACWTSRPAGDGQRIVDRTELHSPRHR